MIILPKQFIAKLIENKVINEAQGERIEIDALNKKSAHLRISVKRQRHKKKDEVLKVQASFSMFHSLTSHHQPQIPRPSILSQKLWRVPIMYFLMRMTLKTESVYVATGDPLNLISMIFWKRQIRGVILTLANIDDIIHGISISYSHGLSPEVKEALAEVSSDVIKQKEATTVVKEAPIAKIVDTILEFAMKGRASDIHIEAEEDKTRVRYRIDGVLQEKLTLPRTIHDSLYFQESKFCLR